MQQQQRLPILIAYNSTEWSPTALMALGYHIVDCQSLGLLLMELSLEWCSAAAQNAYPNIARALDVQQTGSMLAVEGSCEAQWLLQVQLFHCRPAHTHKWSHQAAGFVGKADFSILKTVSRHTVRHAVGFPIGAECVSTGPHIQATLSC